MREIRFRGLRTDGKGWVYGSLILPNTENEKTYIQDNEGVIKKVIPESVGQFTGLKDRNGNDIYEGDNVFYDGIQGVVYFEDCSFFVRFEYTRSVHLLGELERDLKITVNIHEQK